jgi:succinate-semialdehyde dehydrogenase / glutarate-semialdehyde dehydrogenase
MDKKLISYNPADGSYIDGYSYHTAHEVESIIRATGRSQEEWNREEISTRAGLMLELARILQSDVEKYARLITMEMGKPIRQSRSEIEKCASVCEYFAGNAARFLSGEHIDAGGRESYVAFKPLGVVFAIMPWNFPFWQVFRFAAPALMAGNGALLKHASNVTGSAMAIEKLFMKAGFPVNLFRTLKISSNDAGRVINDPVVAAVTITGSVQAGRAVAAEAGAALKKIVLELGGSDPYIVLADADLDEAVPLCIASRLINSGQSCIAAKRFIVVRSILDEFKERFIAGMQNKKTGDPMDEENDTGPLATEALRDELHAQVLESIGKGAKCHLGGKIPGEKGAWYLPTVLTGCQVRDARLRRRNIRTGSRHNFG